MRLHRDRKRGLTGLFHRVFGITRLWVTGLRFRLALARWRLPFWAHDNVPSRIDEPGFRPKAHRAEHKVKLCCRLDADDLIRPVALEKEQLVAVTNDWFHGISFGYWLSSVNDASGFYGRVDCRRR
jgi:hypothetical protein